MGNSNTIWIIAGESSGDAYGARLADELKTLQPEIVLRGMGADAMNASGVDLLVDATDLGIVGFVEVFKHLPKFWRIFHGLVRRAAEERPDCVVLIDYPGFNLRFAAKMHALGIKVVYYISPQVWAWGKRRIPKIAKYVDKLLVIFPFEPGVFNGTDLDVQFVGHPLIEILNGYRDPAAVRDPQSLLLLPGSRASEIDRLLPAMLRTASWLSARQPDLSFVLPCPNISICERVQQHLERLKPELNPCPSVKIVRGETRQWLQRADAGLAASGTVTIEAAILGLPLVVVYRVNRFTFWLARMLVKIPYFTMVNLVVDDLVYEEFLQQDVNPEALGPALEAIMRDGQRREDVLDGITRCVEALGVHRNICRNTANAVLEVANESERA